jgi:hypothetical protein
MKMHSKSSRAPSGESKSKEQATYHSAEIYSPDEVEFHFQDFSEEERAAVRGRWMLAGAVNDALFSSLAANEGIDIAAEVASMKTLSGAAYTVITCQIDVRQHRFVLPMYEPKVVDLLTAAAEKPLSIYLENKGPKKRGITYDCPLRPTRFQDARSRCQSVGVVQKVDYIVEFPAVVGIFLAPDAVPSLNDGRVVEVDASYVLPLTGLPSGRFY